MTTIPSTMRSRRAFITTKVGAAAAAAAAQVVRPELVKTNNGFTTFRAFHACNGATIVGVANHPDATDMLAGSANGTALSVFGRTRFQDNSGVARIKPGRTKVDVSPGVDVEGGAFVLLTPRSKLSGRDLWSSIQPAADNCTIHMSGKRNKKTLVAWLLLG